MLVLAIDPGTTESAWVLMQSGCLRPHCFDKCTNENLLKLITTTPPDTRIVCETMSSYGKPVGKDVFETCLWIGEFRQVAKGNGYFWDTVSRRDEKAHIGGKCDAEIRKNLIDRFAEFDKVTGKGSRDNPDWFYGFRKDVWQAYAVGVTWIETRMPIADSETASTAVVGKNVDNGNP